MNIDVSLTRLSLEKRCYNSILPLTIFHLACSHRNRHPAIPQGHNKCRLSLSLEYWGFTDSRENYRHSCINSIYSGHPGKTQLKIPT